MKPRAPTADSKPGRPRRSRGFSLVEAVVVIVLIGILFAAGVTLLGRLFSAYFLTRDISDAQWQATVALERLTRDLRAARSPTAADLTISPANRIVFTDIEGTAIEYYLSASALTRSSAGVAQTLADGMGSLDFFYLQGNGQTVAATAATVSYITVRLSVVGENYSETLRATVQPRAF